MVFLEFRLNLQNFAEIVDFQLYPLSISYRISSVVQGRGGVWIFSGTAHSQRIFINDLIDNSQVMQSSWQTGVADAAG